MPSEGKTKLSKKKGFIARLCAISVEKQLQCICGTAALSGYLYGYSMAASAMMLTQNTFVAHFCVGIFGTVEECYSSDLDQQPKDWIHYTTRFTAMLSLGTVVGAIVSCWMADYMGRRTTLIFASILYAFFTAWETASWLKISILLARFLSGIGVGIGVAVAPTYITELSPPALRGKMCGLLPLSLCIGEISAGVIGELFEETTNGWRYTLGFAVVVSFIMLIGLIIFPESPRWLYSTEGKEACQQSLQILRQTEDVSAEMLVISNQAASEAEYTGNFMESSIFGPKLRKRTLIACSLQLIQQLSGIVLILAYGTVVLEMVGVSWTMVVLVFLYCMNGLGTVAVMDRVDISGRRHLLLQGSGGTFVANLSMAIFLKIGRVEHLNDEATTDNARLTLAYGYLFCLAVFMIFFASGLGLVPWIYATEIFPLKSRATAVGMANVTHAFAFYAATYFENLVTATNLAFAYLFFAVCCFLSTIFIYFLVPETAQKNMDQIDAAFKRNAWDGGDLSSGSFLCRKSKKDLNPEEEELLLRHNDTPSKSV